jgi:hypothetical protein
MVSLHQFAYWRFFVLVVLGGVLFFLCILVSQYSARGPAWRPLSDPRTLDIFHSDVQDGNETAQVNLLSAKLMVDVNDFR